MPVLEVIDLTKEFGRRTKVLVDLCLELEPGTVHGLLGPNGSGKSSGLHVLTGLDSDFSGAVVVNGTAIAEKQSRLDIGFAPDDLPLPSALTAREYLSFHDAMRRRDDSGRARELACVLGLDIEDKKMIGSYSHGMKRKLQLVASAMHQPRLLVLDEPFRGLDPHAAAALRELITAFARAGGALLLATHDMLRAERDCDEVTILNLGHTVCRGRPTELVSASQSANTLEDVFLENTRSRSSATTRLTALDSIFNSHERH